MITFSTKKYHLCYQNSCIQNVELPTRKHNIECNKKEEDEEERKSAERIKSAQTNQVMYKNICFGPRWPWPPYVSEGVLANRLN